MDGDLTTSNKNIHHGQRPERQTTGFLLQAQFAAIENFALWEGRVNSNHLQSVFDVKRQKASDILKLYCQRHSQHLEYDASLKGRKPTADFQCAYASGHIDEYSRLLAHSLGIQHLPAEQTGFYSLEAPLRNLSPVLVQPLIRAIREGLRVDIGYTSLRTPEYDARIISPHSLVFDGMRWHTRAYCEKNRDYRDFVLSRFNGEACFEGKAEFGREQDKRWNKILDLVIQADPRLNEDRRRLIELDYQMEGGKRVIKVRASELLYMVKRLRLDRFDNNPNAQQIIIAPDCLDRIKPYLPEDF